MVPNLRTGLLVVLCVVLLAGCGGLTDGATETPTASTDSAPTTAPPSDDSDRTPAGNGTSTDSETPVRTPSPTPAGPEISVVNGSLSVDQDVVFERVNALLETDARPPTVELRNLTERHGYDPGRVPFYSALGFTNATLNESAPGGVTVTSGRVYLHTGDGGERAVERVLVHEFVHAVQIRSGMLPWLNALDQPRTTTDLIQTRLALTEGGAVFATDEYTRQHQNDAELQSTAVAERFRNGTPTTRLFWARYYFGNRYVENRVDSPADLAEAYDAHPRTTEGIIHNLTRDEEPPRNLSVTVDGAPSGWTHTGTDQTGELVIRIALETELSRDRARAAAAGWGNDSLYAVRNGDRWAWIWSFRWDTRTDADEFESAFGDFAAERRADDDRAFDLVRSGETTTVAFIGDPAAVGNATATADRGNVTVTLDG